MVALIRMGLVNWTVVARIGASHSALLSGKDAGCRGQISL